MRRAAGLILTALGAFLVTLAALLRLWVPGQVIKFPLNEYSVTTMTGAGITYLNRSRLEEFGHTRVTQVTTAEGNVSAGSGSTAVWSSFSVINDDTRKTVIGNESRVVAFNRRTGQLVNCCGASIQGSSRFRQSGLGFRFPFNTGHRTYRLYDVTLHKTEPYRYEGTSTIDGMTVDKFTDQLTNVRLGQVTIADALVGVPGQGEVTLPEFFSLAKTYWVDPVTGIPVDTALRERTVLASGGQTRLVVLAGALAQTPRSVLEAVAQASKSHQMIDWIEDLGPLAGLAGGAVALVGGVMLLWRSGKPREPAYDEEMAEA